MGMSRFSNGKFDLIVIADHPLDDQTKSDWKMKFYLASEALFDATEGQLSFGNIYIGDNNLGLGSAEFVLHGYDGRAFATFGGYGKPGQKVHLFANSGEKTIVHEFGHHAFELDDEYTSEVYRDPIDKDAPAPAGYTNANPIFNEVPLEPSELVSADLEYAWAIIKFGNEVVEAIVREHTPTLLDCYGSYPSSPLEDGGRYVIYQQTDGLRCATVPNANFSLMDDSNDPLVTEFCTAANHNLARFDDAQYANAHTARYGGLSCWEVIHDTMLERWDFPLTVPDPEAVPGPDVSQSLTYSPPAFHDLVREARFVLVMDRSGSMAEDGKIVGARRGVEIWLQTVTALGFGDFLSVIWYDDENNVVLPLSDITTVSNVQDLIDSTNSILPQGFTNIRDALLEAHQQITSHGDRAALQGVILLTDGVHNRPVDTSPLEVVPTFQEEGIPIMGIALGGPENVDFETLETLCAETGGVLQAVSAFEGYDPEDDASVSSVAGVLVGFAHALLRNGAAIYGDVEIRREDRVASTMSKRGKASTKLKNLAGVFEFQDANALARSRGGNGAAIVRFHVEDGADYTLFTAAYQAKEDLEVILVDPEGNVVEYDDNQRILIECASPIKIAIVKKPKAGLWKAVLARKSTGEDFRVFYYAEVDNRRIAVHGEVSPRVPMEQAAVIRASATWKDQISGLDVIARIRDPQGGLHSVELSDAQYAEPNSGDYVGTFVPEMPGRHSIELTIANRGKAILAGGIHRVMHGPEPTRKEAQVIDISSGAPPFVRRIPLYFDAGKRPQPIDTDDKFGGRIRYPVKPRKTKLKPSNMQRLLKRVQHRKSEAAERSKKRR
jgi:hypothetical protein